MIIDNIYKIIKKGWVKRINWGISLKNNRSVISEVRLGALGLACWGYGIIKQFYRRINEIV